MPTSMEWLEALTKLAPRTDFALRCVLAELLGQDVDREVLLGVAGMLAKVADWKETSPDHAFEIHKIQAVLLLETGSALGAGNFTADRERALRKVVGDAYPRQPAA